MFKSFLTALIKLLPTLPGAILGLRALIEAGEKVGFDKGYPLQYAKIYSLLNTLLYIATEHWPLYIIVAVGLAFFWALVVAEPKAASKREFQRRRKARIGTRR